MSSFSVVNLGALNPFNPAKVAADAIARVKKTIEDNKAKIIEAARIAKLKIEEEKRLKLEEQAKAQAEAQAQADAEAQAQIEAEQKKSTIMKLAVAGVAAYFLFK